MAGFEAVISWAFVSATINVVVKTAYAYCAGRSEEKNSMKVRLDHVKASLPRIQSAIEFADQKTFEKNKHLEEWLQQLKDFIYEAGDVMDDIEAIRIQDSWKSKSKVSEIGSSSAMVVKSVLPLPKHEIKLKTLVEKIEEINNTIPDFITLVKESESSGSPPTEETSSFLPINKKIFGRDNEIELILNKIIINQRPDAPPNQIPEAPPNQKQDAKRKERVESSDDSGQTVRSSTEKIARSRLSNLVIGDPTSDGPSNKTPYATPEQRQDESDRRRWNIVVGNPRLKVLPIVGIRGIGKTTIAQVIYNHERVRKYFDIQGWVYVTSSPDPKKFLYDILCAFDVGTSNSTPTITGLDDGLYWLIDQAIKHKTFLLVFDDLREGTDWINSIWKRLIEVLACGACESTIIVTTLSNSIATMIGTVPILKLDYLPEQQFSSLFEYYAFGHDTLTSYEETVLRPIGKNIAAKLHGPPLVAVVVGSSLSITKRREDWENILESDWWEWGCQNVVSSLRVGFQNLDPDLKQCFSYCSLFPRNNHVFEKDRLVQMWIAQGFINPTEAEKTKLENKEIEIEDIGRSKFDKLVDRFFFQSTESKNLYIMHDLIRELSSAISSDMYVYGRLKDNTTIPSSVRHLACDPNTDPDNSLEHVKWDDKHRTCLRTIMFLRNSHLLTYKSFKVTIDKLVGLRLLDLSYFTTVGITRYEFPYRNCQLSHLRFLDLSYSGITTIATSLCDLVHLQVLDLRGCKISELPDGMNKLINLRHLYASLETVNLLHGIGRLTNLQELEEFFVREEEGFTISELAGLKSLHGQLTIRNIEEVSSKEEASLARLEEKKYLTSLIYDVCYAYTETNEDQQGEVLEGLKPHKNIRELCIRGFMSFPLPSWIMEMNNLTGIELLQCRYVETLPPFGSLPSLEVLKLSKLESITSIGEEFYGTSDVIFPFLRELTFYGMYKWTTWSNPSIPGKRQFFPCLQKLQIIDCMKLSGGPLLYPNSSLVELFLEYCDQVVKNFEEHFPALTCLTRLRMWASSFMKIDIDCDRLCKLQVLSLENIDIGQLKGQTRELVNLEFVSERPRPQLDSAALNLKGCIEVHKTYRIPHVPFRLGMFPSLQKLWINWYDKDEFTYFEDSWLPYLEELELCWCLKLKCLPPSLSTLPSLKKFTLEKCPMIHSLPPDGLPQSLEELYIIECSSELMQGCQPNIGAEWSKISHVPCIRVVDKLTNLGSPAV